MKANPNVQRYKVTEILGQNSDKMSKKEPTESHLHVFTEALMMFCRNQDEDNQTLEPGLWLGAKRPFCIHVFFSANVVFDRRLCLATCGAAIFPLLLVVIVGVFEWQRPEAAVSSWWSASCLHPDGGTSEHTHVTYDTIPQDAVDKLQQFQMCAVFCGLRSFCCWQIKDWETTQKPARLS